MLDPQQLQAGLAQFTGTETWYRFRIGENPIGLYTEGIQWLAENADCYWLLTEVFLAQAQETIRQEPFQVWQLTVDDNGQGQLTCEEGNGKRVFTKSIPYTDFPLEEISFWLEYDGEMPVLLLPREH